MQTTYQHPWYIQQQKLENITDSESELMQSQKSGILGLKLTDEEQFIWAAALYEGEGCLSYYEKTNKWSFVIQMTDKDVIDHLAEVFSLNVNVTKRNAPAHWKKSWVARTSARSKIFGIVCEIYPYLGARRREKCDKFLQWYAAKEGLKYD